MNLKTHIKDTIRLAIPVSLGQMGHMLTMVADSIMLGNYNADHLASATFMMNLQVPFMVFGIGASMCISPIISEKLGAKQGEEIQDILMNSFVSFIGISILIIAFLLACEPLLHMLGQDEKIITGGLTYYRVLAYSVFFVVLFQVCRQFSEGFSNTMMPMVLSIVGNGINIVGNYLLIYGPGPFPELGIDGAAYSTLFARFFMFAAFLAVLIYGKKFKVYFRNLSFSLINTKRIKELMNLGLPVGIQHIGEISAFALSIIFIGWLGPEYIVAHNIAINLAGSMYMLATGLGAAATIRVGFYFGEKSKEKIRQAIKASLIVVTGFMTCTALILILGHEFLPSLYVKDKQQDILAIASAVMVVAGFFQLSDGLQMMGTSILRAMRDVKIPTIYGVLAYWVGGLPLGYILAFHFDLKLLGFWCGFASGLTIVAILMIFRMRLIYKRLPFTR